ncbi:Mitochondrial oxaloacetate transport protein [Colletotrichum gloeosporioides]|uniref:Mitochondrial oxaloacetate transport protein n=1 Tax=Colletotrichum gloeosporioides TaxID=474922 RepID=A0A8H4FLE6_COLGL|nr:Mitochondrial oxaloacetate transport protein [Colletotrichum gloeosporioides]KAF3806447.1 Mitochondrial oxaloacetate transport protein [Colletotrichum gloeosporioides]
MAMGQLKQRPHLRQDPGYRFRPLLSANPANWQLRTPGSAVAIHGRRRCKKNSHFLFRARSLQDRHNVDNLGASCGPQTGNPRDGAANHRNSAFIAGGIAACGAVTATHPFETVKIRFVPALLALSPSWRCRRELKDKVHQPHQYRGPLQGVSVIVRNEGVRGIYRGIGCAYVYQVLLNGCRLGFYEPMRHGLASLIYNDGSKQSLGINMFCGAGSGIMGAAAGSPFFLVKTRLQSFSPFLPVGTQHKYRNAWNGLSSIYHNEGVRGLYRGVGAAMIRTGFGSSVQLPTYFFAKRRLVRHLGMEEGLPLHLASSTVSGFVVCCVMHPPDTIMSRLYNQNGNLYKGVFDCLSKTVRTEGLFAIYKGFLPHLARILPHTILTLTLAEQTNKLIRKLEDRILPTAALQNP